MTSRQRLRRSAAVPRKLLNLLVRRFSAAVLRRFAAVPKTSIKSMCGGSAAVCAAKPPYPYALRGAFWSAPRVHGSRGGASQPRWTSPEPARRTVVAHEQDDWFERLPRRSWASDLALVRAVAGELAAAAKVRLR
jgi:hypothetical protein